VRCTEEMGSLPGHRRGSQPCVVTTREPRLAGGGAGGRERQPARWLAAALDADEPHTALAPHGSPDLPDARTVGWMQKETATASRLVPLQGAGTSQRSASDASGREVANAAGFRAWGRHAAMLAGLTGEEKRARVGRIAKGLGHWAIPQEEALHLSATVHSSLMIGGMKCSGEKAMCAHCLKNGMRTEETAAHVHYKCPKAKAVWQVVMADWNEKTGDQMSPADLTAAVLQVCAHARPT
jgi:phage FluMu protein Com